MGELIYLGDRVGGRSRPERTPRPAFFFDISCPFSYLAAERVERMLGDAAWIPVSSAALNHREPRLPTAARDEAERRAAELRLPLVWPDRCPTDLTAALRASAFASRLGDGARFTLAASRLAFCGGYDLDDPEVLAEAAAAAGIRPEDCFDAIGDAAIDGSLRATAHGLACRGVRRLPAMRIGRRLLVGERRLPEAAALIHAPAVIAAPVAPHG
jgi:2-hydroxychromene-2-carboxylate isomerase